jgi:uncharacterized membrane protein YdcZ (DUF606 family)
MTNRSPLSAAVRAKAQTFGVLLGILYLMSTSSSDAGQALVDGFKNPPDSAKPRTWWHWVGGNVSREGITADLEAMKEIGLGGFQNFSVVGVLRGPVKFFSPEWHSLVQYTVSEANRLGLEMSMEGNDGWSESGGPWVPVEESMQKLVWSETAVEGGETLDLTHLRQPEALRNYYGDLAIFAVPDKSIPLNPDPIKITIAGSSAPIDFEKLKYHQSYISVPLHGYQGSSVPAPVVPTSPGESIKSQSRYSTSFPSITVDFGTPVQMGNLDLDFEYQVWYERAQLTLEGSQDGIVYVKICDVNPCDTATFKPVCFRYFRLFTEKKLIDTKELHLKQLHFSSPSLGNLPSYSAMSNGYHPLRGDRFPEVSGLDFRTIQQENFVELTGKREWQVPAGHWRVLRIGHTTTGKLTSASSSEPGFECNKLDADAVTHHIDNMFGPLVKENVDKIGTTFKYILLDSWEAGFENWTPKLETEFKERRGYDMHPWLPAITGEIVNSADQTQRFLWDYRKTLGELVAENHYQVFQNWAHAHHMGLASEAAGIEMPAVVDQLLCKKYCDIPMGEFWVNNSNPGSLDDSKEAASAAHIYGQNIAATESFTSQPQFASWTNDPASLKAQGDVEFCLGVNRFVFHRFAHQPWLDRVPGMSMGDWGINFDRTNTWWKPGKAWIQYLSRCEYLLQQGQFQADFLFFYGEGAPVCVNHGLFLPPEGYDYDVCNADVLLNHSKVVDGRIVLDSGTSYRVLVLPDNKRMSLPVLKKIKELVDAGATISGTKPLATPSLVDFPNADEELQNLANTVWGNCDGVSTTQSTCGKGKVFWNQVLDKVVSVPPDFHASVQGMKFIHRTTSAGDLYFVSNQSGREVTASCTFRVHGRQPELWHPDSGVIESAALFQTDESSTTVPIHFDPTGSVFVVFRHPPELSALKSMSLNGNSLQNDSTSPLSQLIIKEGQITALAAQPGHYEAQSVSSEKWTADVPAPAVDHPVNGSWNLTFPPKLGAPESATFDKLTSWTDSTVDGIKYFSGTATYTTTFSLDDKELTPGQRLFLNLGTVKNLAAVRLNGHDLGILWKSPFVVDITAAAVLGRNKLEIEITNLWPNRLIRDKKLPVEQRITWTSSDIYKGDEPLLPSGLLGPVVINFRQTVQFKSK